MSKLDRKKELLTTLRAGFGIIVAIILTISAGLIKIYYANSVDMIFYIGALFDLVLVLALFVIVKYLIKNIQEIEDF